jgi:hypothetical protein
MRKFGKSVALSHFVFVDIPIMLLILICVVLDVHSHEMVTHFVLLMWMLDVFVASIVFTDTEEGIHASIDAAKVYEVAESRKVVLQFNETEKMPVKEVMNDLTELPDGAQLASAVVSPIGNEDSFSAFNATNEDDEKPDEKAFEGPPTNRTFGETMKIDVEDDEIDAKIRILQKELQFTDDMKK